jgi:hypothetical protein
MRRDHQTGGKRSQCGSHKFASSSRLANERARGIPSRDEHGASPSRDFDVRASGPGDRRAATPFIPRPFGIPAAACHAVVSAPHKPTTFYPDTHVGLSGRGPSRLTGNQDPSDKIRWAACPKHFDPSIKSECVGHVDGEALQFVKLAPDGENRQLHISWYRLHPHISNAYVAFSPGQSRASLQDSSRRSAHLLASRIRDGQPAPVAESALHPPLPPLGLANLDGRILSDELLGHERDAHAPPGMKP